MTEDILQTPTPPGPPSDRRRMAVAALGGGLAVILLGAGALAVSGAASADNDSPQPSASGSAGAGGSGPSSGHSGNPGRDGFPGLRGPGGFGIGGVFGLPGIGPGDALHGTAVVRKPDGTFQTLAAQQGKVTSVSATAISVKSDDGYSATYVVDKDTVVGPGGKLTDIKTGADVAVTATVTGTTSTATRIIDLAGIKDRMQQFMDHFKQRLEHPMQGERPGGSTTAPSPTASSSATA